MTVYLLLGDDEERKSRGVEKLRDGRTVEAYDASAVGPETLVSACNSFSLFGEGPFVVLKDLDAWNAAQKAVIVDYLEDPSPGSDLILLGKKLGAGGQARRGRLSEPEGIDRLMRRRRTRIPWPRICAVCWDR